MILLTGSTGFIGSFLLEYLSNLDYKIMPIEIIKSSRNTQERALHDIRSLAVTNAVRSVVHCAGISTCEDISDELLQDVNIDYPVNLIQSLAQCGLKKFIFLSSIKVLGDRSPSIGFSNFSCPDPQSRYAVSKLSAETALRLEAEKFDVQLVIMRMPVVYGPEMKGNFLRLFDLVNMGIPIPVSQDNKRAQLAIYNLSDFVRHALMPDFESTGVYNICDGEQPSSYELVRLISSSLRKPFRPIVCSMKAQKLISSVPIAGSLMEKNFDNNYMVPSNTCNWKPVLPLDESLLRTASWYLASR